MVTEDYSGQGGGIYSNTPSSSGSSDTTQKKDLKFGYDPKTGIQYDESGNVVSTPGQVSTSVERTAQAGISVTDKTDKTTGATFGPAGWSERYSNTFTPEQRKAYLQTLTPEQIQQAKLQSQLLRSPTSQFSSQKAMQEAYNIAAPVTGIRPQNVQSQTTYSPSPGEYGYHATPTNPSGLYTEKLVAPDVVDLLQDTSFLTKGFYPEFNPFGGKITQKEDKNVPKLVLTENEWSKFQKELTGQVGQFVSTPQEKSERALITSIPLSKLEEYNKQFIPQEFTWRENIASNAPLSFRIQNLIEETTGLMYSPSVREAQIANTFFPSLQTKSNEIKAQLDFNKNAQKTFSGGLLPTIMFPLQSDVLQTTIAAYGIGLVANIGISGLRLASAGAALKTFEGAPTISKIATMASMNIEPVVLYGGLGLYGIDVGSRVLAEPTTEGRITKAVSLGIGEVAPGFLGAASGWEQGQKVMPMIQTTNFGFPKSSPITETIRNVSRQTFETLIDTGKLIKPDALEYTFGSKTPYIMEFEALKGMSLDIAARIPSKGTIYENIFSEGISPFKMETDVLKSVVPEVKSRIPSGEDITSAIFSESTSPYKSEYNVLKNFAMAAVVIVPNKEDIKRTLLSESESPFSQEFVAIKDLGKGIKERIPSVEDITGVLFSGDKKPFQQEISVLNEIPNAIKERIPAKTDIYESITGSKTPFDIETQMLRGIKADIMNSHTMKFITPNIEEFTSIISGSGKALGEDFKLLEFIKSLNPIKSYEEIPLEKITPSEVISGKEQFPKPSVGETIFESMGKYRIGSKYNLEFGLPEEYISSKYAGYHASPEALAGSKVEMGVGRGGDVSGLYVAPSASTYFTRVGGELESPRGIKEFLKSLWQSSPLSPQISRVYFGELGRLPKSVRTSRVSKSAAKAMPEGEQTVFKEAEQFLRTSAKKGKGYVTPAFEAGKMESEIVISPETMFKRIKPKYRTDIDGIKVPIPGLEMIHEGKAMKSSETWKEFKSKEKLKSVPGKGLTQNLATFTGGKHTFETMRYSPIVIGMIDSEIMSKDKLDLESQLYNSGRYGTKLPVYPPFSSKKKSDTTESNIISRKISEVTSYIPSSVERNISEYISKESSYKEASYKPASDILRNIREPTSYIPGREITREARQRGRIIPYEEYIPKIPQYPVIRLPNAVALGKKNKLTKRKAHAYQVKNPFADLEDVLGTTQATSTQGKKTKKDSFKLSEFNMPDFNFDATQKKKSTKKKSTKRKK